MKRSDKERLKKIVATWESLKAEMHKRGITLEVDFIGTNRAGHSQRGHTHGRHIALPANLYDLSRL